MFKKNWWLVLVFISLCLIAGNPHPAAAFQLNGLAEIISPAPDTELSGAVTISGSALIEPAADFWYYKVEFADNLEEPAWAVVGRSRRMRANTRLASWDTTLLADGLYYLRAVAVHKTGNFIASDPILVIINNGANALSYPEPIEINAPLDGATVSRQVNIVGTVTTQYVEHATDKETYEEFFDLGPFRREYDYYKVEYSPGPDFSEWHLIDSLARKPVIRNRLVSWETTGLPNGDYALRLRVVSESGNYLEDQVVVTVNNPPPPQETRVEIIQPSAGAVVSRQVRVTGSAALNPAQYQFKGYTLEYGQGTNPTEWIRVADGRYPELNTRFKTWVVSELPNGLYTLRLQVEDLGGQITLEDRVLVTIDNPPPPTETLVEITSPLADTALTGRVRIVGTATLDARQYRFGQYVLEYGAGETPAEWTELAEGRFFEIDKLLKAWEVRHLANGPYTLRLRVQDAVGDFEVEDRVVVTIENPPPPTETIVEITSPQDEGTVERSIAIRGSAALDPDKYDFGYYILEYGPGAEPTEWTKLIEDTFPVVNTRFRNLNVRGLPNGLYTIRLRVADATGEMTLQDLVRITVDNPATLQETLVEITEPKEEAIISRETRVMGSATLASSDYTFKTYTLEYGQGTAPEEWTEIETSRYAQFKARFKNWDVSELADGLYTLRLRVEDASGTVNLEDRVTVEVDNPPPPTETVVALYDPLPESVLTERVRIVGTAVLDTRQYKFGGYRVEYGVGETPNAWFELSAGKFFEIDQRFNTWDVRGLENGLYTLRLYVQDASGDLELEDRVLVTVENPPPPLETEVEITSPRPEATIARQVSIKGSAALDANSYEFGAYRLEYGAGVEPTEWVRLKADKFPVLDTRFQTWDVSELPNGLYTLRLQVEDATGEFVLQDLVTVTVNNRPPPEENVVEIIEPLAGTSFVGEEEVKIFGTATLDTRQYTFNRYILSYGEGRQPKTWLKLKEDNYPVVEDRLATLDLSTLADGPHTFRLRVEDTAGKIQLEDTIIITVISDRAPVSFESRVEITQPEFAAVVGSQSSQATQGLQVSQVSIEGSAIIAQNGPEFGHYRLEYSQGNTPDPADWVVIETRLMPVSEGQLAIWDVGDLENGKYNLRLVLVDKDEGVVGEDTVTVFVVN